MERVARVGHRSFGKALFLFRLWRRECAPGFFSRCFYVSRKQEDRITMAAPRTSKLSNGMTSNNKKAVIILVFLALVLIVVVCLDSVLQSQQDVSTLTALLTDPSTTSKNSVRQGSSRTTNNRNANPLLIPQGTVPNLPSIRVEDKTSSDNVDAKREIYGGAGDKSHLGGFTQYDGHGVSPNTWTHMMQDLNVRSVMDIGCGRGISSSWFLDHGISHTLCVEGSHDAYERTLLPDRTTQMVEHDYSRGPWWPQDTYDAVWAVEFLEVGCVVLCCWPWICLFHEYR